MRRTLALAATIALTVLATPSRADIVERAAAKDAYDRGIKAYGAGDYATAAKEFASADALAPSPTALQAALEAATEADVPAVGAELIERSKREKQPRPPLAAAIEAARKKFGGRGGFVHVVCPASPGGVASACNAKLDGVQIDTRKTVWAVIGTHTIAFELDGEPRPSLEFEVKPDETVDVTPPGRAAAPVVEEPVPEAAPPPPLRVVHESSGLPPTVFWIGTGLTVVLGAATMGFGLSASGQHEDFVDAGCTDRRAGTAECTGRRDDGEAAQTRTNIALTGTIVAGAATAVIGLFLTRWHSRVRTTAGRPGLGVAF